MTRVLYIILFLFSMVFLFDLWSYRSPSIEKSLAALESYQDNKIRQTRDKLLRDNFLSLLSKDSLNARELSSIQQLETQLSEDRISTRLYSGNKLLFWTKDNSARSDCRSFKSDTYRLDVCVQMFHSDGRLFETLYEDAGIRHKLRVAQATNKNSLNWNGKELLIGQSLRPYRLNNLILMLYLLLVIVFAGWTFYYKSRLACGFLIIGRLVLLYFEAWHLRFMPSSIMMPLFEWQSYSNIDFFTDLFFVFLFLIYYSKTIASQPGFNKGLGIKTLNAALLVLLIASFLRLIQSVAFASNFNIIINDISSLDLQEVIIFVSLVMMITGLFIFATSYIQLLKQKLQRTGLYAVLVLIVLCSGVLSFLFQLDISIPYLLLYLLSFFILIDLFIDIRQKSITWIIWWAIFFGIYISALFFNYDIQKQVMQRAVYMETLLNDVAPSDIDSIVSSGLLDSLMADFERLLVLPDEASYSKSDINKFLSTKYDERPVELDLLKPDGRLLFNSWPGEKACRPLGRNLYFDDIDNVLWQRSESSSGNILFSGIKLRQNQLKDYPLLVEMQDSVLNFSFDLIDADLAALNELNGQRLRSNSRIYLRYVKNNIELTTYREFESIIKPIALFSFIFTLLMLFFLGLGWLSQYYELLPANWPLNIRQFESLNSRIQTALVLVILLSFIIVALVSTAFLKNFIESKNADFLDEKLESFSTDLYSRTGIAQNAMEALAIAENYEEQLARVHNCKIEIFALDAKNKNTDYYTWAYFTKQSKADYFNTKKNGESLSFLPFSHQGKVLAYIQLNHGTKALKGFNIYDFLGSIFNVYVFIFLLASIIAIFVAKSVTKPLLLLNQKLSALRLGKRNELISWGRDDEMGTLIKNYNLMVRQLEDSAELLAKTERDNAWREMAKQVAHEIKNPLTPMKMYIQHLEKAVKQQPERAHEISKKISQTLLEQVENLTQIADSFSNFAELPQSANEKLELNKVVEMVHNLFRKRDDMDIVLSEPIDPIYVYADKNQLIRILNNLVKNATESIPQERRGEISLFLTEKNDKALIEVRDNGTGIPADMYDKIFQPKFTTKDSGSGLGLAIAQNMIESMNGRLYFRSKLGEGTSFFIELDVIRQKPLDTNKRISLE